MWVLMTLAVLIAVLGVFGWGLLQSSSEVGGSGASGGPAGERDRSGREEVEVPALKGLGVREARERFGKAGFEVGVRFRESSGQDTVLAQSVAGGDLAREGSKIFLTVGEGPQVARVPNLVGLTYAEAEADLEEAGLLLGGVNEVSSGTVPAGVIADQDPPAGTTLESGSYVYLTTSVGPPGETAYGF